MARRDDPGGGGSGADDGGGRVSAHASNVMLGAFGDPASGRQWAPLLRLKTCHPEGHEQLIELGNTHERRGSDLDPDRGSLSVDSTRRRRPCPASVVRTALAPAGRGRYARSRAGAARSRSAAALR
jgi:hypothetical protein